MPFKSKAQMKKMNSLEKEGKVKKGTSKAWAAETPNIKALPQKVGKAGVKTLADVKSYAAKKYGAKK